MKIFSKDKQMKKTEIEILITTLILIGIGLPLVIFKPILLTDNNALSVTAGFMMITVGFILAVMFLFRVFINLGENIKNE
jgi:hypothetical protein